jgi:hypothetical protein
MSLASPAWLFLLIPWLAALLYLMLGKPPREAVPFLWLWRGPAAKRTTKPSFSKLPLWIAMLMLSAALAIVAAAGPQVQRDSRDPAATPGRVGIAAASARGNQLMLRLLNESPRKDIPVKLQWEGLDDTDRTEVVQLPESGERDYFLDLPDKASSLTVSVDGRSIALTRRRTWPRVQARMPLPESLRRVISAYEGNRPSDDDSAVVGIAADEASLGSGPGAVVGEPSIAAAGKPAVTEHPVTGDVNWPAVLSTARIAEAPPRGYVPVVKVGDRTAVAIWDQPYRVWVGFDSPSFASQVDYVVFWTNVFDFVGQGGDTWQAAHATPFATPRSSPVQKAVQKTSPFLICASVILLTIGLLTAQRRTQLR